MSKALNPESNEFLGKMLAHSASVMIWICDTEKMCVYFNHSWLAFRGATLEQEYGFGWAESVHPDDYDSCLNVFSSNFDKRMPFCMDYRMLRHDGEYRWIRDEGAPYFDEHGTFHGYIGSCFDITDQKELQVRVNQAEKMDALGKLASSLAHDLNNKLAGIGGFAELIELKTQEPAVLTLVEKIKAVCDKTAQTTKQLLNFSRKKLSVTKEFDMEEVINQTVDLVMSSLDKRFTISRFFKANNMLINGDASAIQNVVLNLLVNARDAMHEGGEITVRLSVENLKDQKQANLLDIQYCVLEVSDEGEGMTDEVKRKVFEPFFTTKKDGTGFGLASSYATVKQHNGDIFIESEPNQGTTVKVYLPLG